VPTLIIVEVGLGRAVHDIETNEAIARLEHNPSTASSTNRFSTDSIHCARSHERRHASSLACISSRLAENSDTRIAAEEEIGIESLRQLRGESWEFGIGASSPQELGTYVSASFEDNLV
jgi:hypothetical protein